MFRAIILSIFRSTRLCVTACGMMHPRCCRPVTWRGVPPLPGYRPATSWVHHTTSCNKQSSVPEDGQNNCPKHVSLIGIINKTLLLHLFGCLYYFLIHCFTFRNELITDNIQAVRKNLQRHFSLPLSTLNYLLVGDDLRSDCRFVCGLYKKHRVSSPVIKLLTSVLSLSTTKERSTKMLITVSVLFGRQHSTYQIMTKGFTISISWRIQWKLPAEIPTSDTISYTNFLLSLLTMSHTRSTLGSFLSIDGRPLQASPSTSSRPYWKRLCQSYNWEFLLLYHHTLAETWLTFRHRAS